MAETHQERQAEEIEVLESIYGDDFMKLDSEGEGQTFCIHILPEPHPLRLVFSVPSTYPDELPMFELRSYWMSDTVRENARSSLIELFESTKGEVVIFQWIEWLRENISPPEKRALPEAAHVAATDGRSDVNEDVSEQSASTREPKTMVDHAQATQSQEGSLEEVEWLKSVEILRGEPLFDRKSQFQAHAAHVTSEHQVRAIIRLLLTDRKIARATHNIMAYRVYDEERGLQLQDNDDDGENAAGGRLAHLLELTQAQNVVVVVSRWYGGILLGPDRFKHINNVARQLLEEHGLSGRVAGGSSKKNKK